MSFNLTIKNKLIMLGALAITALSLTTFLMFKNHETIRRMNDMSNDIQADVEIVAEEQAQQLLLVNSVYAALMNRASGRVAPETMDAIHNAINTIRADTQKLLAKKADYLNSGTLNEIKQAVNDIAPIMQGDMPKLVEAHGSDDDFAHLTARLQEKTTKLKKLQAQLNDAALATNSKAQDAVDREIESSNKTLMIIYAIALITLVPLLSTIIISISRPLRRVANSVDKLAQGDYGIEITGMEKRDEIGQINRSMTELRKSVETNVRQQAMLDHLSTPVLLANKDFIITYANHSSMAALKKLEKFLPVALDKIVGSNIDIFHKHPSHQRGLLQSLGEHSHKTEFPFGNEWLSLNATMLKNARGEFDGAFIDWNLITEQKYITLNFVGQIDAIGKSQAVIEFQMDGTIIEANANFLNIMGYTLEEIKGKHHSLFIDPTYKNSSEYSQFWEALARGEFQQGEYKRIAKGGREIWIQASYNPILDGNKKPFKVVKYAIDVTQMVTTRIENEQGMNESVKILTGLSEGNLTQKMTLDYKGTFAQIKSALNATIERLRDTVLKIKESAESVNSASSEISAGSTDLSQRTEEQASSLEETAASMEELTGTVRQNSENARNANQLSSEAQQVAERGGQVVGEAIGAMNNIEKSSKKISDIISVIDEIAFQTNLLALNAAVEAARAGDAGKGFAVVASEVRSLAGRSATASKEIKALIMESSGQVKTGAELVNQAGTTLKDIVGSVKKVAQIISEIANASTEQSTGIDEINTAVSQMDEMTQQNAALVEENTAAAQSLVQQAQMLAELVSFFRVDESAAGHHGFEPVIVKPAGRPSPVRHKASKPSKNPMLSDRRLIASGGRAGTPDREWEEF